MFKRQEMDFFEGHTTKIYIVKEAIDISVLDHSLSPQQNHKTLNPIRRHYA